MGFRLNKLVIVGLGLIGGSLAKALKQNAASDRSSDFSVAEIVGCGRSETTLRSALELGFIDSYSVNLAAACADADLVVIAAPIGATEQLLTQIKQANNSNLVITDAGSVKGNVVAAAESVFGEVPAQLIPGHPIAGSEKSGVHAADATLYQQHKVILTPTETHSVEALSLVTTMWESVGASVLLMGVDHHDSVLAATSHLPHLLAFSLVDTLAGDPDNREIFQYAAGGFRDFTRIAASDPTMWLDIFTANCDATVAALDSFSRGVTQLREAIVQRDNEAVLGVITRAKSAREHFSAVLEQRAYIELKSQAMSRSDVTFFVEPGGSFKGEIRVPGDKSISHRSIMLGSLANGVTRIRGFLEGEDSLATLQAFRDMGVVIEGPKNGSVTIYGVGLHGLKAPSGALYLGNSGTSMRLLMGLLCAQQFDLELVGDASLSKRPMRRVSEPLTQMQANISTQDDGTPPVIIKGKAQLQGIAYSLPVASAQVKSAILLAGLYAKGTTEVTEPAPTRDHTERMLRGFGYEVETVDNTVRLRSGGELTGASIDVPADISSTAFFMVAASISAGSDILLQHVGVNPTRVGVINILRLMGANIDVENQREVGGEPVADIRVRSAPLKGIQIPEDQVPLAIDEFPSIFIAAACAEGKTVLTGAHELRVKESDRIQAMADGMACLGVEVEAQPDGIIIQGLDPLSASSNQSPVFSGGRVDSLGDHRIAMAFAVAGLRAKDTISISNCANVATSFPDFVELAQHAGLTIKVNS